MARVLEPLPLLCLPDLVLQHVITFMSSMQRKALRLVCRKLFKVASAGVRRFSIELDIEDRSTHQYLRLHERFPNIQEVTLSVWSDSPLVDPDFSALAALTLSHLKSLTCLDLRRCHGTLTAAGLCSLLLCRSLRQLLLSPPSSAPLGGAERCSAQVQAIVHIICQLHGLSHLVLAPPAVADAAGAPPVSPAAAWDVGDVQLASICSSLHSLVQLELSCCTESACMAPLAELTNLRRLAVHKLPRPATPSLTQALQRLPSLHSLGLLDSAIGDESLEGVGKLTGLVCLELQGCTAITEAGLRHLQHLQRLQRLQLPLELSATALQLLVSCCGAALQQLEAEALAVAPDQPAARAQLQPLLRLSALSLGVLGGSAPALARIAPRLSALAVWEASDVGITRALSRHTSLSSVALSCDLVTDAGLVVLGGLPQLRELTLADAHMVSPERVVALTGRLPALRCLQLCSFPGLCDSVLAGIVASAPLLEVVGLQDCGELTDQGLAMLASLRHLTDLWVDSCGKLGVSVLLALAAAPSLRRLKLWGLPSRQALLAGQELLRRVKGPRLLFELNQLKRRRADVFALHAPGSASAGAGCGGSLASDVSEHTDALQLQLGLGALALEGM